jgi:hypothetical protein
VPEQWFKRLVLSGDVYPNIFEICSSFESGFNKDRQLFLCGIFSAANLFLVCQFELKAVCQSMPACFDDIF